MTKFLPVLLVSMAAVSGGVAQAAPWLERDRAAQSARADSGARAPASGEIAAQGDCGLPCCDHQPAPSGSASSPAARAAPFHRADFI